MYLRNSGKSLKYLKSGKKTQSNSIMKMGILKTNLDLEEGDFYQGMK